MFANVVLAEESLQRPGAGELGQIFLSTQFDLSLYNPVRNWARANIFGDMTV